jgi:hypothetical protein
VTQQNNRLNQPMVRAVKIRGLFEQREMNRTPRLLGGVTV